MANHTVWRPKRIVIDVLFQIDRFYYPIDFLVLDTQLVVKIESKIPFILGRHFLITANTLIKCRNGLMKLFFGNMTLKINIFSYWEVARGWRWVLFTYMIDTLIQEEVHQHNHSKYSEYLLFNHKFELLLFSNTSNVSFVFDNK